MDRPRPRRRALMRRMTRPSRIARPHHADKIDRCMKTAHFPVEKSEEEWRRQLTPEQYAVLRGHGTERPGSCALLKEHRAGTFTCAACGQPLFVADRKFESGTGWPSFFAPLEGAIGTTEDRSFGMKRVEVHCNNCGGHLGHVFEDGPPPTGLRYCNPVGG